MHQINNALLIESPYIIERRKWYVAQIRELKQNGRFIFYFDETYIHQSHCPSRVLTDTTIQSAADAAAKGLSTGIPRRSGKGIRLIVVGMGSSTGFVQKSVEVWKWKKSDGKPVPDDYHEDIDAPGFHRWLEGILPELPPNSVLVSE